MTAVEEKNKLHEEWAVFAHKALNVRTIARSAIRYLLEKYVATAMALIPFGFLVTFVFASKDQTIKELLSGAQGVLLTALTVAVLLLMRSRQSILDSIDKRFFRDRYNARKVLTEPADQVRGTRTPIRVLPRFTASRPGKTCVTRRTSGPSASVPHRGGGPHGRSGSGG